MTLIRTTMPAAQVQTFNYLSGIMEKTGVSITPPGLDQIPFAPLVEFEGVEDFSNEIARSFGHPLLRTTTQPPSQGTISRFFSPLTNFIGDRIWYSGGIFSPPTEVRVTRRALLSFDEHISISRMSAHKRIADAKLDSKRDDVSVALWSLGYSAFSGGHSITAAILMELGLQLLLTKKSFAAPNFGGVGNAALNAPDVWLKVAAPYDDQGSFQFIDTQNVIFLRALRVSELLALLDQVPYEDPEPDERDAFERISHPMLELGIDEMTNAYQNLRFFNEGSQMHKEAVNSLIRALRVQLLRPNIDWTTAGYFVSEVKRLLDPSYKGPLPQSYLDAMEKRAKDFEFPENKNVIEFKRIRVAKPGDMDWTPARVMAELSEVEKMLTMTRGSH